MTRLSRTTLPLLLLGATTFLAVVHPSTAVAACPSEVSPFDLAQWLRGRREFFRAAGIYLELLARSQRPEKKLTALECLVDTYVQAGQFDRAAEALSEARRLLPADAPSQLSLSLNSATVAIRAGNYDYALTPTTTESLVRQRPSDAAYVRGLALVGKHEWLAAREVFGEIASGCATTASTPTVCRLVRRNLIVLQEDPPKVRPWLAASLSALVPGSGFIYTHDYFDALLYFGGVGLGGFLTYDTAQWDRSWRDQRASTYILGALTLLFYTSNIIASQGSAQRLNEVRAYQFRQALLSGASLPMEPLTPLSPVAPHD
jgi:hypothetical protein